METYKPQSANREAQPISRETAERNWNVFEIEKKISEAAIAYRYIFAHDSNSPILQKAEQDIKDCLTLAFLNGRANEDLLLAAADHAQRYLMDGLLSNYLYDDSTPEQLAENMKWTLGDIEKKGTQFTWATE